MEMAAARPCEDLPDECWEAILRRLDHHRHLEPISLVCKRFLALTDLLRTTLDLPSPAISPHSLPDALYSRFRRLHSVALSDPHPDIDRFVRDLAVSALPLQSLRLSSQTHFPRAAMRILGLRMPKTLRSLSCSRFDALDDGDLFVVADCFPYLERLDVSYPRGGRRSEGVTDDGVLRISIKLRSLLSVDLSGNFHVSGRSIECLGSNCALLCDVKARDCERIVPSPIDIHLFNAGKFASLLSLEVSGMYISDAALLQLAGLNLKLQKLALLSCGFIRNVAPLFQFLQSCRSLRHFHLQNLIFRTELTAADITTSPPNVQAVNFGDCHGLSDTTLFNLLSACPNLEEIDMTGAQIGSGKESFGSIGNCRVRTLVLSRCRLLTDEILAQIGSACPKLKSLDVSHCEHITGQGIVAVMTSCTNVKQLKLRGCRKVKDLGLDVEFPRLEVLSAPLTGIGDEWLSVAWKTCKSLFKLEIGGSTVTEQGLKELVSKHKQLKELSLSSIYNLKLSSTALAALVISRVALKKILLPDSISVTKAQRDFFLKHGCLVLVSSWSLIEEPKTLF